MANVMTLQDTSAGGESVNLYDFTIAAPRADGHNWGAPSDDARMLEIAAFLGSNDNLHPMTKDALIAVVAKINRILGRAVMARTRGLGRLVTLTHQPDTMALATTWTVWGGALDLPSPLAQEFLLNNRIKPQLRLIVERRASSTEVDVIAGTGLVSGNAPISHMFVHYTGATVFSSNTAGLVEGSLWQSNIFTTSPTNQVPANGDIIYFGNVWAATSSEWGRIIMGLSVAGAGTYTGAWTYWNGSAWTAFTPTTNDFKTTREFDTARSLGQIIFGTLASWAKTTINSVNAYWVRCVFTLGTMTTVPVRMNGPVGSLYGCTELPVASVPGDAPAPALVHLKNSSAGSLAAIKAGIVTGHIAPSGLTAPVKPPLIFPLAWADLYQTTGDNLAAVEADTNTPYQQRVKVTVGSGGGSGVGSLSDRAQHFGGTQYVTVTPSGGDKITTLGQSASMWCETMVILDSITAEPTTVQGQWDETGNLRRWWLGIENFKLVFRWQGGGGNRYAVTGTTTLEPGVQYLLAGEWKSDKHEGRVYVNAVKENERNGGSGASISASGTMPYRIGKTVSMTDEVGLKGSVSWAWVVNESIADTFDGIDNYSVPTAKRNPATLTAANSVYYEMDDYLGTAVILDTGNGTAKNGARTTAPTATNDAANAKAGYFVSAGTSGPPSRLLGMRLAATLAEEYAGPYRAFVTAAPPSSGFTTLDQLELLGQFNVGDVALPFSSAGRRMPDVHDVRGVNSGYYVLDLGTVYLPPEGFYDGFRGSGSGRLAMQFNLYFRNNLAVGSIFYLGELYLFPLDGFFGEYQTFRTTYSSTYLLAVNAGVSFDSRGPGAQIIAQSTTAGYTVQDRNPYAKAAGSPPRIYQQRVGWIVGLPLRGYDSTGNDYVYRNTADLLQSRIKARPQHDMLATA